MTDPRELLDVIAQRAECTQHLGGWERHNAAQCSEFTHREAPKLMSALRAVLDIHRPIKLYEDTDAVCWHCGIHAEWPCKTHVAITEALGGTQ